MTMRNTKRRLAAGASAMALAATGVFAMGTAASAAVGPDQPDAPTSGSLTIHKTDTPAAATPSDGTEQSVDGNAIAGVEFTLWQLGKDDNGTCKAIDLADTNAWAGIPDGEAPKDTDGVKDAGFCLTDAAGTTLVTDANGDLTFDGLALGLYYVQETDVSGAKVDGEPVNVVGHAAPFYVTIPLPNDGDWIYDVFAYPKNQITDAPEKTINEDKDQTGLKVGDTVEWTITQTVPKLANADDTYESASIWDVLDPAELSYVGTTSVTLNGDDLTEGTDYTIDSAGVTWKLTETGLGKIKAGDTLEVVFTTKVLKVTETGEIENGPGNGTIDDPGYGSEFNGEPTPPGETTPYTYWGQLKVTKVDQDGETLAGAEFQVYPKTGASCPDTAPASGLVATGTSGADGIVLWDSTDPAASPLGLFVANSNDGPLSDPSKDYCLYETKVPAGYTGAVAKLVTITPGTTATEEVEAVNTQKEGPDLPLTGANGTMLMTVGGLALVAIAGGVYLVSRRRQDIEA